ncbi:hypothetical protein B0H14DRAFT_3854266 [Mycena olivaceomarginata]|nr:hypothetical protein B0H14DRAFT_3854266 [Mycena olivaceomarginata]
MQNGVLRARRVNTSFVLTDGKLTRAVGGGALIPADTPFLLTSRSTVIVHAAQKDVKAGSVVLDKGLLTGTSESQLKTFFGRPEALQAYREHVNIETPEFTHVNTPCVGAQPGRLHDTFDSDDVYTKRHLPFERAEKRSPTSRSTGRFKIDALGTSSQGEDLKAEMLLKAKFLKQRYQGLLCLEELKKPTKRRRRSSSPSESSPSRDASLPPHLLAHQSSPPQEVDIVEPYLDVQVYCGIPLGVVPTSDGSSAAGVVEDVEADEVAPVVLGRGKRKKVKNSRYNGSLWEGH